VIDLLADGQGRTMSELSSVLLVPGPTMTKLVDRLVDAATVYRAVDDRDRRRVVVRLSEAGTELREALRGPVRDAERAVLDELREDAVVFVELLERLERAGPA
jgi:DNA-binding MarR family transcriptional regulator